MRKLEWTFVFSLLAVCAGFPLIQAGREIAVDKEVPHVFDLFTQTPTKKNLHHWDETGKDRSIFAKWLRPKTLQLRYDVLGETAPKSVQGRDGWLFYNQDVDYLLQPPYTDTRFYKGSFDTVIAGRRVNLRNPLVAIIDFRDKLKARGVELLLVPIPGKPSIYPEKVWRNLDGEPESPSLKLLEDLRGRGFHVVDLFRPLMAAKAKDYPQLYLKHDTHWTPRGLEVAAGVIAEAIGHLNLAPDTAQALRYALQDQEVERWGDIAEMTKVPDRRKIWGNEKVTAQQVMDTLAKAPYQDDATSPILWLGDSFSRIYQTDAPKSAGIIAHVAYRLNQPLASIVNDGGASTVVRQQLARRGEMLANKKLVVWAFVERDLRFGSKGWQLEDLP